MTILAIVVVCFLIAGVVIAYDLLRERTLHNRTNALIKKAWRDAAMETFGVPEWPRSLRDAVEMCEGNERDMPETIPHETIREQLRQPFAAHETWWHRVAEQLLREWESEHKKRRIAERRMGRRSPEDLVPDDVRRKWDELERVPACDKFGETR